MEELQAQRSAAHRTLSELRDAVGHAIGISAPEPEKEPPTSDSVPSEETEVGEAQDRGEQMAVPAGSDEDENFEEKLEAWVNWTGENQTIRPDNEG